MAVRPFTAVLYREEDLYVVECPEVGTVSQGYTIEEALANLKETTELYLGEFPARGNFSKSGGGGGFAQRQHFARGILRQAGVTPDEFLENL